MKLYWPIGILFAVIVASQTFAMLQGGSSSEDSCDPKQYLHQAISEPNMSFGWRESFFLKAIEDNVAPEVIREFLPALRKHAEEYDYQSSCYNQTEMEGARRGYREIAAKVGYGDSPSRADFSPIMVPQLIQRPKTVDMIDKRFEKSTEPGILYVARSVSLIDDATLLQLGFKAGQWERATEGRCCNVVIIKKLPSE